MATALATIVMFALVRFAKSLASKKIDEKNLRYKTRKAFSMAGYIFTMLAVVIIFSD